MRTPTLGGAQLWTDVMFRSGWRVQGRALRPSQDSRETRGHYRLLSPTHIRHFVGSREACEDALEDACPAPPPDRRELVVMLHGLGRTARSMTRLAAHLTAAGYATAPLDYASMRAGVKTHAEAIDGVMERMPDYAGVCFVSHSLGGIITRAVLAKRSAWQERLRPRRVVMLAPPSQGASIAARLDSAMFRAVFGPAGLRMSAVSNGMSELPPAPRVPFGIIAGGLRDGRGINPLITGDDDGVVAVRETRLDGAVEHRVVPAVHTLIMQDPRVMRMTTTFFQTGSFGE